MSVGTEVESRRIPAGARHARILDLIHQNGFVSVADVAAGFAVSDMTIRRDLWALEDRGLLVRTHGGAVGTGRREVFDPDEPAFSSRRRRNAAAKAAIARAAAALIGPGESIGLDVGTSTLALAEEIARRPGNTTVVTNNLHAAAALGRSGSVVHVLGGMLRGPELSVVGSNARQELREFFLTRVFLGVSGVIEEGLFDYSPEDTEMKRAFIAQAEQVVVLCDSSKFDHRSLVKVCELGQVATIVTEAAPPPHLAATLERAAVSLVIAAPVEAPAVA